MTTITKTLGIRYNLGSRHLIYMKEELARYYRDKLVAHVKRFVSPTMNITDIQMTALTFGPRKKKETLYGANLTLQFSFRGGDEWEINSE